MLQAPGHFCIPILHILPNFAGYLGWVDYV
jgi:hypothetical protein